MAKKIKKLKSVKRAQVKVFKIKNRRGYAGIFMNHLTEGRTSVQVLDRMAKALKRSGYELK